MKCVIEKLDHFGQGISHIDGKIVFVNKALQEEIVDVEIVLNKKNYLVGKIKEVLEKSPKRVISICPYYDKCGGCNFLHTTYQEEIRFKKEKAQELLGHCNEFYETDDLHYRNKVTLHINNKKIGFYEEESHDLIDINYCYLVDNKINDLIKRLSNYIKSNAHCLESVVIKTNGKDTLMDVTGKFFSNFLKEFADVTTIINNNQIIKGEGNFIEDIDGYQFQISSEAFFQVNKSGLESINKILQKYLEGKNYNRVLDLYSGMSTWGILLSSYAKKITCVEVNQDATKRAEVNKKMNNINNLEIINGRVEDYIDTFQDIDLVIIDPPRKGLDKKTRDYLKRIHSSKIIYISCDMFTLKRDLEELSDNYTIEEINLVDMFRGTYHVECVTLLSQKKENKKN